MLKLEKISRFSELTIRMRERDCFFEPRVIKALLIALILHSIAFFMFHITPFYFSSTYTFPKIQVQSTTIPSKPISQIFAHIEEEEPFVPPIALFPSVEYLALSPVSAGPIATFDPHVLHTIEERMWPKWEEPLSLPLKEPKVQLIISGDLAHLPLLQKDPILDEMQTISFPQSHSYMTYNVLLDDKTGELFWYERIQSSEIAALNWITEKAISRLRFAVNSQKELERPISGTLNFAVVNDRTDF